jgi:hypothetical protein
MSYEAWKATSRCLENPRSGNSLGFAGSEEEDREKNEHDSQYTMITKTVMINDRPLFWNDKDPPVEIQDGALALMYLETCSKSRGGLSEYNRELRPHVASEEGWTVLMLRGIAWSRLTRRNSSTSGRAIPSSCWDNQRPVWII